MSNKADDKANAYWKANLQLMGTLLLIWFAVSFGASVLFVDQLNAIQLGGFKLGFWFAQQGSMLTFVLLIFVYVIRMNRIDREHGVDEE